MALAAATHHSAQLRAGEEKLHEKHDGLRAQKRPSPGERPAPLLEVRPQGKLQRHAGIGYEIVQNLDVFAPQMVDQLPDILLFFAALSLVFEQVIEVPKILPDDVPMRTTVRDTQLVEQLVEVPTIVSFSSLQRTLEQNVDIPVPHPAGRIAGLQGFHPEQSSTTPQFSKKRNSERIVEQIVDTPVSRGGLQGFRPGQSSSSFSHRPAGISEDTDEPGERFFFLHFFPGKKVRVPPRCPGGSAHGLRRLMGRPSVPTSG